MVDYVWCFCGFFFVCYRKFEWVSGKWGIDD